VPDPVDRPDLPDQTSDDTDAGWGERSQDDAEAERERWLEEQRPPHHGG
jgi:hypothetical protein